MATRKEQKAKSEATKVAKERAKGNAAFAKPTREEIAIINKGLNDKRQNIVQALKAYYQLQITTKQAILFQERFEENIEKGTLIEDTYGLPMSKDELELEAMKNYIQLRFMKSELLKKEKELVDVWKLKEGDIDKYWKKWFVDSKDIQL